MTNRWQSMTVLLGVALTVVAGCTSGDATEPATPTTTAMSEVQILALGKEVAQCVRDNGLPGFTRLPGDRARGAGEALDPHRTIALPDRTGDTRPVEVEPRPYGQLGRHRAPDGHTGHGPVLLELLHPCEIGTAEQTDCAESRIASCEAMSIAVATN
jgi:hypothetical protein